MSDFKTHLIETVRVDAEVRARGKGAWFWRALARPMRLHTPMEGQRPGRFTRRAVMSAVSEAADRFTAAERRAFEQTAALPEWFWPWVEDRAVYWDSEV